MPQPITRAFSWLRSRPRATRIVISVGVPTGIAFIILGVWLDSVDWWPRHGYLLNLFSGLTGACFGVPFALAGLDYLIRNQEEHREAGRVRARAAVEAAVFVESLLNIFNGRTLDEVSDRVRALLGEALAIKMVRANDPSRKDRERDLRVAFNELLPAPGGRPHDTWSSFRQHSNEANRMRLWRTAVQTSWTRLDGVRAQMADDWIDKVTETAAHRAVADLLTDDRSPWKTTSDPETEGADAMRNFLRDLKALCEAARALEAHTR
ncbi:AtpZ/AtpI family protein [Streptomyces canus]|uniref:AtpZ/AtpI family protein n=1 Tax=Streptomyces canus TaxID=58343 RepID=UPI0033B5929A